MKPLIALLALFCAAAFAGDLPMPAITPGAVNPAVTQANIGRTICVPGYTKTVRPPAAYTNKLKRQQLRSGTYASTLDAAAWEEDHLVPLTVGGHPRSIKNLWPQHRSMPNGAADKDRLEVLANKLVCSGKVPLADMQSEIAADWVAALRKYGKTKR